MSGSILEALAEWLQACPLLEGCVLGVDWLPDKAGPKGAPCFSVEAGGGGQVRRYLSGQGLREYPFVVRQLCVYGADAARNLEGNALFEQLGLWMEQQAALGLLPVLPEGVAVGLEASGAVLASAAGGSAVYRMPCVLRYVR